MSEAPSDRSRVHRLPERAAYDADTINEVLDQALICHVAIADADGGAPHLIPTIHTRIGTTLYLHGSNASRTLRGLRDGAEITVAATIIDGLVLARSAFNSSMNYRSVVVFGTARLVTDHDELLHVARSLADHVAPGRGADARPPTEDELRQTTFMAISLDEASAKVRVGPPHDDDADLGLPIWAGVLPLHLSPGEPEPDPALAEDMQPPDYVTRYRRPGDIA